jgi:hypothetical protein
MFYQRETGTKQVPKEIEEKREELIGIVRDIFQNCAASNNEKLTGSELEEITEKVANHFMRTIPLHPEGSGLSFRITIRSGGIGDGSSIKPGNIWLNWKQVLIEGSESILSIAGAVAVPWLVPFAGLVVCNRIWSVLHIKITERHAAVIWTMWLKRDKENSIKNDAVLDSVNIELSKFNRLKMNHEELNILLKDLEGMKCIEKTGENKWRLRELVRVV